MCKDKPFTNLSDFSTQYHYYVSTDEEKEPQSFNNLLEVTWLLMGIRI